MNNLLYFLKSLTLKSHKDAANRLWNEVILPSHMAHTNGSRRIGGVLQVTLFPDQGTPCEVTTVQFGGAHPKNVFFAAEKTWRLWENPSHEFSSQTADPVLDDYSSVAWTDLKQIKFGGAIKIKTLTSKDMTILSFSGLHPHVDEAVVYSLAKVYMDLDMLMIPPYPNNPATKTTLELFVQKQDCFFQQG